MPSLLFTLVAAGVGLVAGSCATLIATRWHESSSLLERPRCPECRASIRPHHLVPVISWLFLRGRCASCHRPIHVLQPIAEILGALLFGIAMWRHPWGGPDTGAFVFEALLAFVLLTVSIMDLRWQEVPVELLTGFSLVAAGIMVVRTPGSLVNGVTPLLLGVGVPFVFFGAQLLVSRGRWIGSGDLWVGVLMGIVAGWPGVLVALYMAYMCGGIAALLLLFSGRLTKNSRMAFAPFLAAATMMWVWWGPGLLHAGERALGFSV